MRGYLGLLAPALLAACATSSPVTIPAVMQVPVTAYVPVPSALTRPCPIVLPQSRTVAEAIRVAAARRLALVDCNAQLEAIRRLGMAPH